MRFDIITIFPEIFDGVLECGMIRRGLQAGRVDIRLVNLRDFADDRHRTVDDRPFGGGEGMVFMPEPIFRAVEFCRNRGDSGGSTVVLLSPQGRLWNQEMAREFSESKHVILICGRYEGVDQRVIDHLVDGEVSIGDFILTGGEIPAMVVLDSVIRLLPGVLGNRDSIVNESFTMGHLDYPQYTRPSVCRGLAVPEVLLSGDHAKIADWRRNQAMMKTVQYRPELAKR
jgi:tRNA (guanine37-N1)-methyltransferase